MTKIDLKKERKHLYGPSSKEVVSVDVPDMNFIMIDGKGDPNTSKEYQEAIEALYPVAYKIKFNIKKTEGKDYSVMPLEGLWWVKDMKEFATEDKSKWLWTMMIMQPDFVTKNHFDKAIEEVSKKKILPSLSKLRFEKFSEGKSAQIMHIGPFSEEGPTVAKVHQFITDNGWKNRGKHHEIYLSDIRKADPKKWKTVIRQPYR